MLGKTQWLFIVAGRVESNVSKDDATPTAGSLLGTNGYSQNFYKEIIKPVHYNTGDQTAFDKRKDIRRLNNEITHDMDLNSQACC